MSESAASSGPVAVRGTEPLYGINELPPLGRAIPLGIQHVLVMFASNITMPLIVAGAIGATTGETAFLVQVAIFVAGICTLFQTVGFGPVGARLPIVQGTSLGFTVVAIPLAQTHGLGAVFGGAMVGGLVQVLIGGSLRWLKGLFPPLVTGLVVAVIGVSLLPTGVQLAAGGPGADDFGAPVNLALATLVLVLVVVLNQFFTGFVSAGSVLLAIAAGYLVALPLELVSARPIAEAAWFSFPTPVEFGLSFPVAALVGMSIMAVATSVETIGDLGAVTMAGENRDVTDKELSGGVIADGVGTAFASLFSALPNTSYSQNVGVVGVTGVMSRHVVSIGAGFLILAGLLPKLGAVIAEMPTAVLGGGFLAMAGMVTAAGIKLIGMAELDRRNQLIIAVSLGVGIGLVNAQEAVDVLPEGIRILLITGIVPAALVAIVLNVILPKPPQPSDTSDDTTEAA